VLSDQGLAVALEQARLPLIRPGHHSHRQTSHRRVLAVLAVLDSANNSHHR
jgi:hypothetical protein